MDLHQEEIYREAKEKMAQETEDGYQEALQLFEQIPQWNDADLLASQCRNALIRFSEPSSPVSDNKPEPKNKMIFAVICAAAAVILLIIIGISLRNGQHQTDLHPTEMETETAGSEPVEEIPNTSTADITALSDYSAETPTIVDETVSVVVITDTLMRKTPDDEGEVMRSVLSGLKLTYGERTLVVDGKTWILVKTDEGYEGWVEKSAVNMHKTN